LYSVPYCNIGYVVPYLPFCGLTISHAILKRNDTPGNSLLTSSCRELIRWRYTACVRWDTILIDSKWNCLCASLIPNKVTGNSFSLHLKVESMWNTEDNKQVEAIKSTDNNALDDMLRMNGCWSPPSPKINLNRIWIGIQINIMVMKQNIKLQNQNKKFHDVGKLNANSLHNGY